MPKDPKKIGKPAKPPNPPVKVKLRERIEFAISSIWAAITYIYELRKENAQDHIAILDKLAIIEAKVDKILVPPPSANDGFNFHVIGIVPRDK